MSSWVLIAGILILGYLLLYLTGRVYLRESFSSSSNNVLFKGENYDESKLTSTQEHKAYTTDTSVDITPATPDAIAEANARAISLGQAGPAPAKGPYTVLDTTTSYTRPYVTTEDKQGDFELDFVLGQEGGMDPRRDVINAARRKHPFDWMQYPPSASRFQEQQMAYVKDNSLNAAPIVPVQDKLSMKVLPPDEQQQMAEETAILQAYKPKSTSEMNVVDATSVQELMDNLYSKKGLIPEVVQKANNVFEVIGTREKNPKIVYEDEVGTASIQSNELNPIQNPDEMVVVPGGASDLSMGLQPQGWNEKLANRQFDAESQASVALENMFGPKMSWQQWG